MSGVSQERVDWFAEVFDRMVTDIERALVGKRRAVELAVACLVSQGHLLIEDVPGNGKTTLAKALARTILGSQSRIQFTPDLSPDDITGVVVFDDRTDRYRFHPGPVFNTLVLADEINRAMPRTQSALLEVMEEGKVTVRGMTNKIGPPFMVIATQNPTDNNGTFPLPEAQLDRFLMCTSIGYPDEASTMQLMASAEIRDRAVAVEPLLDAPMLAEMLAISNAVEVPDDVLHSIYRLADATRQAPELRVGLSVRGCLSLVRAAKTWAAAHGRTSIAVDDVVDLARPVIAHRFTFASDPPRGRNMEDVVDELVASTLSRV